MENFTHDSHYTEGKIHKIKEKGLFGVIVEAGAGCPVYAELCNHPNTASRIVEFAFSPNSWDYNKSKYHHSGKFRAVGPEVVAHIAEQEASELNEANFVLVDSVQMANAPDVQTHGWFCLTQYKDEKAPRTLTYHFTIDGYRQRKEYIGVIAQIGLDILASCNSVAELDCGYIDCVMSPEHEHDLDIHLKFEREATLASMVDGRLNVQNSQNTTTVFGKDGRVDRLNTLLRETKNDLIVFKGSFNPVHPQHLALMRAVQEKYPKAIAVFAISVYNRDLNKVMDINSLVKRIDLINALGYDVLVDCYGEYKFSYESITRNVDYKNQMIHYPMGQDIVQRFLDDEGVSLRKLEYTIPELDGKTNIPQYAHVQQNVTKFNHSWKKCNFWWELRPGFTESGISDRLDNVFQIRTEAKELSSTDLRLLIQNKDTEGLKKHADDELINLYFKIYDRN
jgi:hypothetical protein